MAFDPKKAGEEADDMIAKLNQVAEGKPEDRSDDGQEAIATDDNPTGEAEPAAKQKAEEPAKPTEQQTPDYEARLAALEKRANAAEQRWRVAQGMIEKKDEQLDSMRTLLAQLQAADRASPTPEEAKPARTKQMKASDIEEYGSDMVDFVSRVAADAAHEAVEQFARNFESKVGSLETQVETVSRTATTNAEESFYSRLDALAPQWQELNEDAGFLAWLDETEALSGTSRKDLLQNAAAKLDAKRVSEFFNAYQRMSAPTAAATPVEEPSTAEEPSDRQSLESLAAPGKSKVSAQRPPKEGRIWTPADISKLYDDKRKRRLSQEEFEKRERDLFRAQQEGRIRAA